MKIISVNRSLTQPVNPLAHISIIPDSAMIRDGKPFFIPGFSQKWEFQASIAFRVKRLGKKISSRFAHRYYDAIALAVNTIPIDVISNGQPISATYNAFDGAFIIGDWIELNQLNECHTLKINLDGKEIEIDMTHLAIDDTIASISQFITLKIGDIITPAIIPIRNEIKINTIIEGSINNTPNIKLKFK